jgi:tetratricopeptide (TPR) repeat protein
MRWKCSVPERVANPVITASVCFTRLTDDKSPQLSLLGRHDEAIAEMRKAQNLDPLSLIINADLAELLVIVHSYDESIRLSRMTIEMDPNFALAHNQLGQAYLQKQMPDEATGELQKAVRSARFGYFAWRILCTPR